MRELKAKEYKCFEDIKQIRPDGTEFWSARELASALEYTKWENFQNVIKRAMIACENSGHSVKDDFPEVRKIVDAGITSKPVKEEFVHIDEILKLMTVLTKDNRFTVSIVTVGAKQR